MAATARARRETARLRTTIAGQREVTSAAGDRDTILQAMADGALQVIDANDATSVHLLDPDGTTLSMATASGDVPADRPPVPVTGSLAGLAMRTATTQRCNDPARDGRVAAAVVAAARVGSFMVAPLLGADGPLGVLSVRSRWPGAFDDTDEQQLKLLADSLTGALSHAEATAARQHAAERETQRMRELLLVQREVTAAAADRDIAIAVVAQRATRLFPAADGVAVELLDGDTMRYAATAGTLTAALGTRVPVVGSISSTVLVTGEPAHCTDTRTDPSAR
ncbi:GAF domain-containing protein [Dactylosporangium sp. CS-047395]|uniref:GAF domain-containing protein n=1 Tax=Dactylosporangium sp. CS-047395 TaxID=3239936 RepID=UPI003D8D4A81